MGWDAIGDTGAIALAAALRVNTTLSALYLHDAAIEAAGLHALHDAIQANETLTVLDVSGTDVAAEDAGALAHLVDSIGRRTQLNKARPPTLSRGSADESPPRGAAVPSEPLAPAVQGSRASQLAHRRLMRTGEPEPTM